MYSLLLKYFPTLSPVQQQQYAQLHELYTYWNERINVISRKDIDELYERHVLHSLAIARCVTLAPGAQVLDVGTGGGFPGIPLAIFFPQAQFTLVDSIGKKITVVNEVAQALGLHNVEARQVRAEQLDQEFDFVVSRAVTALPAFLPWVWNKIRPGHHSSLANGILYLKGGDLTEELKPVRQKIHIREIASMFGEPFFETKKVLYLPKKG